MKETLEGQVELKEISAETFEEILRWMYYHDQILTETNMFDVTAAANQLQIKHLISEGKQFLTEQLCNTNCFRILNHSRLFQWGDLEKAAWRYLLKNFENLCRSELSLLSADQFKSLIESTELVTASEDTVVQRVLEWIEPNHGCESPDKEKKVDTLYGLLKSCRYLLVSSLFVWQELENNPLVQADPRCRELVREILIYKTQAQYWCPQPALHRKTSKLKTYLFIVSDKFYSISIENDPTPSLYQNFEFDLPVDYTEITGAAFWNGALFIEVDNTYDNRRYLCVRIFDSIIQGCCNITNYSTQMRTVALLPAKNSLIAVRASVYNNHHIIDRFNLPLSLSSEWCEIGRPDTQGVELAHVTNVGSNLLMFWKDTDGISMEWFDLDKCRSFISPNKLDPGTSVATFRTADELFILQGDGVLWRMTNLSAAFNSELVQEKKLWNGNYQLFGAIVVNERLYVVKNSESESKPINWCADRYVDGVFNKTFTYNLSTKPLCCIHAAIKLTD